MSEKNLLSITPSYYYYVQLYVCTMTRCEFTVMYIRRNSPTGTLKQKRWFPQPAGQLTRDGDWESSCLFLGKLSRTRSIDGKFINSFFAINMLMLLKPTNSISFVSIRHFQFEISMSFKTQWSQIKIIIFMSKPVRFHTFYLWQ